MSIRIRRFRDYLFTFFCCASVGLLTAVLLLFLIPMMGKGLSAVFFRQTVEFSKMQMDLFGRGSPEKLQKAAAQAALARKPVYELLDRFSRGMDTARLAEETKKLYREYGLRLHYKEVPPDQYTELRAAARQIRNLFLEALESTQNDEALALLRQVNSFRDDPQFQKTAMMKLFEMADEYRQIVREIDLSRREEYAAELEIVKEELHRLLGPAPSGPVPALAMDRYGATRWDVAQRHLDYFIYQTKWVQTKDGGMLEQMKIRRDDPHQGAFAGTELAPIFSMVENNLPAMLLPRPTVYWQYFIDDSTPGHFFGGVWPEILGTLILTLLCMFFSVPLGIISAAYLVEYAGDNTAVRAIRTCINTLAGVPSIVYGLFGLAFFVLIIGRPCVLTASLTLALLVLPVIIRASEEAIRAVPQSYKEASLSLGAGKFKTFTAVTLPAAGPGILTGIILSLSRAAGETAPILFAGAVALGPIPDFTANWLSSESWLLQPTRALSYGCYDITVGDRLAMMVPHNQFGMVMTLILLVLLLNVAAIIIRSKMSRKLRGF